MVALAPRDLLDRLREATRAQHERLDAAIQLRDERDYRAFLSGTLASVAQLEPAVARWLPSLIAEERAPALRADLALLDPNGHALGLSPLPLARPIESAAAALGAAYVLEGSTLGGLVVAKRADELGVAATQYLRLRGRDTAARWRAFLDELLARDRGHTEDDRAEVIASATAAFEHYERAYRAAGIVA